MTVTERRTRPRDRKDAIKHAAAELFAERGFAGTSIEDIGARVGVTGPAIYRHFPSKDALLDAVVLEIAEMHVNRGAAEAGDTDPVQHASATLVTIALEQPESLATYLRDRRWLSAAGRERHREIEVALTTRWAAVLSDHVPDVTRGDASIRLAALLGALAVIGSDQRLPRPRLDALLIESCVSVMTLPASRPTAPITSPERPWRPLPAGHAHILDTAMPLFRARGFHGTSIDDIAAAAGMAVSTLYRRYDTKHDILIDAFDRVGGQVQAQLDEALASASSAQDALERLCRSLATITLANVDVIVVTTGDAAAVPLSERPRRARRRRAFVDMWSTVLAEVRPELGEAAARTLSAGVVALTATAASSVGAGAIGSDELSRMALAFVCGAATPDRLATQSNP